MTKYSFVYITTKDKGQARKIARALLKEKLAACCNIIPQMNSLYRWQGRLQDDKECVLIAKTRSALAKKLIAKVKALHTYSVPCVVCLEITAGNPDYLNWLGKETK